MGIFEILTLLCGLALFLYGMDAMGEALKKSAGRKLKTILGNLTSNKFFWLFHLCRLCIAELVQY